MSAIPRAISFRLKPPAPGMIREVLFHHLPRMVRCCVSWRRLTAEEDASVCDFDSDRKEEHDGGVNARWEGLLLGSRLIIEDRGLKVVLFS